MARVAVIGGGSWGIALAVLLHKNGHEITVWSALEKEIEMLQTQHEHKMLPGVKLAEDIRFTLEDREAVEGADLLVMAVASSFTRRTAARLCPYVAPGQRIVNVAKGIEEHTLMTQAQITEQEIPQARVAVLCGCTLAAANFAKLLFFDQVGILVALTVCLTLVAAVLMAMLVGCLLPIGAKKIGFDPAVMASPFITTIVDALSLLVYFRFATIILKI